MWALGYRFCQYLCFIIGPLTILCSCFFWVTNIFSPLTKFDNSILFIGNFAIITAFASTYLDGAPLRSLVMGFITMFCLPMINGVMKNARRALIELPYNKKVQHSKIIIFGGYMSALIPILFMTLESVGCVIDVEDFWNIWRPEEATKQTRFSDAIWNNCSAIFVPNYTMGIHLAFIQCATFFYAPFVNFTFPELVRFTLDKRTRVQIMLFVTGTICALWAYGAKDEDGGFVQPRTLQICNMIFLSWAGIGFLEVSNLFSEKMLRGEELKDRTIFNLKLPPCLEHAHSRWNRCLVSLINFISDIVDKFPMALYTVGDFELAPVYRISIAIFCFANLVLHTIFAITLEPKLVWYSYCAVPGFMTCEAIFFCSAPRRPGILQESIVFIFFPLSFAMTALGHYLSEYWVLKIKQNVLITVASTMFLPLAIKLRHELSKLDDSILSNHIHYTVFGGCAQFVGMIFFIAEGVGCLQEATTIEEIESSCGGEVYPAFGCAANIGANLIYQLGFNIFNKAVLRKKRTTADIMKFSITKHEKFEMGCMLLANVLCLFLYGNSTNGPVTLTLEILVAFIALLWVFIFTSESINVLTFVARMRAEEESSRDRLDWEKGLKDSETLAPKLPRQTSSFGSLRVLMNEVRYQARNLLQLTYATYTGQTSAMVVQNPENESHSRKPKPKSGGRGRAPSALDSMLGTNFGTSEAASMITKNPIAARKHNLRTSSTTHAALSSTNSSISLGSSSTSWTKSSEKIRQAVPAPKRSDGHYAGTYSLSRYIRAVIFFPIVVVLTFYIVAAVSTHADNDSWSRSEHWGWLAYSWNAFVICCMLLIWVTKVRKPQMILESLSFSYWPLMMAANEVTYRHDDMFLNMWFYIRLLMAIACFILANRLRRAMANLEDEVLSNHLQKVAWTGGISVLTPIAYVSMKGSSCIITNWDVQEINSTCGGIVDPLLGVAFHLTAFFGHNLCFLPFQTFSLEDLVALRLRWIQILHIIGISAATVIALFLFGSQREDEEPAMYVQNMVRYLWLSWFVIVGTAGMDLLFTRHVTRRRRGRDGKAFGGEEGKASVEMSESKSPDGIAGGQQEEGKEQDSGLVMGGEGVMLSPGLY